MFTRCGAVWVRLANALKEAQSRPHDLAGGTVTARCDAVCDQAGQLGCKRYIERGAECHGGLAVLQNPELDLWRFLPQMKAQFARTSR